MSEMINKIWHCPGGHTLGLVVRNGSGVRTLLLYRQALDPAQASGEVDVMAIVEGYAADVRCSVCGSVRTWIPGAEAMQQIIDRAREYNQRVQSEEGRR